MDLNNYKDLLNEASELYNKIPKKEKTFMEITGYPHYENVCSNILAFYFDTKEEHGLSNIVLNSLIKVLISHNINIELSDNKDKFEVNREYTTLKGNRIDIVIQNENLVIGIENKIYASIYNDLEDYSNTLNKLKKTSIKVLLSLHNNSNVVNNTDFINITYKELFNQLKNDLQNYQDKNNKWYIFLIDFVNNLINYEGEMDMEKEIINWLNDNKEKINALDKIREIAHKSLEEKEESLKLILEERLNINFIKIWKGNNEMTCYIDSPKKYHIDANITPEGWRVGVFAWTVAKNNELLQIIRNSNYDLIEDDGNHRIIYMNNFYTSLDEISDKVIELYNYFEKEMTKDL